MFIHVMFTCVSFMHVKWCRQTTPREFSLVQKMTRSNMLPKMIITPQNIIVVVILFADMQFIPIVFYIVNYISGKYLIY